MKKLTNPNENQNNLILYLDILGYRCWVSKVKSYATIYNIFNNICFNHNLFCDMNKNNFQSLSLYIVADSVLLVFNLRNKDEVFKMGIFLRYAAMFIMKFISKTGYLLRGGLSYGDFILKKVQDLENNIFIFSKAYNKAVELEKKAKFPRILVDTQFYKKFNEIYDNQCPENKFLKCYSDICYFDYYSLIENDFIQNKKLLQGIREAITENYNCGRLKFSQKTKEKYFYFRDYHNALLDRIVCAKFSCKESESLDRLKIAYD